MRNNTHMNVFMLAGLAIIVFAVQSVSYSADRVVVVPLGGKKCTSPAENSFSNAYGMTFNRIPAGTFTMGSPGDEPGHMSDETQHQVTLTRSFYIQTTQITQQQWRDVVLVAESAGVLSIGVLDEEPSTSHAGVYNANYPVENVSWNNVRDWITAFNILTGESYTLPTEAQWEYAARATTTTAYANPVTYDATDTEVSTGFSTNLHAMGWYGFNYEMTGLGDEVAYVGGTKPVAQKQANRWGLYDMHGNIWEFCLDWYKSDYYTDPGSDIDPQGPATGTNRIVRGGSVGSMALQCRSARRNSFPPTMTSGFGFRLVLP